MTDIDEQLRQFRADVPDPADGAAERILARARGAVPSPPPAVGPPPAQPRRRRSWTRWLAVPAAATAVALVAVALWPVLEGDDGPAPSGGPGLLARAEAAITPPNKILAATIEHRTEGADASPTVEVREWSLAGAGQALAARMLITEGAADEPPTDEDATVLIDRNGKVVDGRYWTPAGQAGRLEVDTSLGDNGPPSLVRMVADVYRRGELKLAGRTPDGALRLTSEARLRPPTTAEEICLSQEVILEPESLMLRRWETTSGDCRGRVSTRDIYTVADARWLPATAENRRLLKIGDWPTASIVRVAGKDRRGKRLEQAPPVPPLDEG